MLTPARLERARQFLRFGVVGAAGFVVDASVLYALLTWTGAGFYIGRLGSYLAAATATWYLNRTFTFADHARRQPLRQWMRFLAVNAGGGAVNYAVYTSFVLHWPREPWSPLAGVAAGSLAGLIVNFNLSRRLVFFPETPPLK
jgi:putative flippase GtrA